MMYRTNVPLEDESWRLLHQHYLDSVRMQPHTVRKALRRAIGETFEGFVQACADRLLVVSAHFLDVDGPNRGLNYVVAARVSDGMAVLATIAAARLGLNTVDIEAAELAWREQRPDR